MPRTGRTEEVWEGGGSLGGFWLPWVEESWMRALDVWTWRLGGA